MKREIMLSIINSRLTFSTSQHSRRFTNILRWKSSKPQLPFLKPEDLEEKFTLGSGPGGQAVNRTANAVFLKHLPTGLWVKCHQTRSIEKNRKIARELLATRLDNHINGENSIENQQKLIDKVKLEKRKEKTKLKYEQKRLEKLGPVETLETCSNENHDKPAE